MTLRFEKAGAVQAVFEAVDAPTTGMTGGHAH
jgi:hypothetical protein